MACTVTDDGKGIDAIRLDAHVSNTQDGEYDLSLKLVRQIVKGRPPFTISNTNCKF